MWQCAAQAARGLEKSHTLQLRALGVFVGLILSLSSGLHASPQAPPLQVGEQVGLFEIEAPNTGSFILRGTLPVPKGLWVPSSRQSPLSIVDHTGASHQTQINVVTRYPVIADGADVVELIARVPVPQDALPGDRLEFPIIYRPHMPDVFYGAPDIPNLPFTQGQIIVRAWDYFDNEYVADLGANITTRTLSYGALTHVLRTHATLLPVNPVATGAASDPLPHLMGIHAYFRIRAREPFVEMTLRVHNGHSGNDVLETSDDALSDLYFKRVEIEVPDPYTVVEDFVAPMSGIQANDNIYSVVKEATNYPVHYMPKQAQFIRRFAIARDNHVARANMYLRAHDIAFARHGTNVRTQERFYSWWNSDTSAYFTQDICLPKLQHETPEQHRLNRTDALDFLEGHYTSGMGGTYPALSPRLGWAHPWGVKDGGLAGGTEIYQYDGLRTMVGASRNGILQLRLRVQMLTDRNPIALYNDGGKVSEVEDWLLVGPNGRYLNCWYFLRPILDGTQQDPFGFTTSPSHQRDAIEAANAQPPYYDELRRYQPTDFQHYTRYNAPAKALIWQTNDYVVKDQMRMQAEAFRLSYNEYDNTPSGLVIGTGLQYDERFVVIHPGKGMGFGRGEGWGLEAMTAVYAFAPRGWRNRMLPWFRQIVGAVEAGQSPCTGVIHSQVQSQGFNGQYRGKQHTEQVIVENAFIGMRETIFRDRDNGVVDRINEILLKSFRGGITAPAWSSTLHGPWGRLAVGPPNPSAPLFCQSLPADGQAPWRDNHQSWSSLAFGYQMTGLQVYLDRAEEMAGSGPGPQNLLNNLLLANELNWENQATMISLLEKIIAGE